MRELKKAPSKSKNSELVMHSTANDQNNGLVMKRYTGMISFDEDAFDLNEHKKEAAAFSRKKAREKRVRRQVLIGKIMLGVATVIVFLLLFLVARELGLFSFR